MNDVIITEYDNINSLNSTDDLKTARNVIANSKAKTSNVDVTIIVLAYNRLDKTITCVNSILEHTLGINYKLILTDNGSTDGTLDFFKSVNHNNKVIIRLNKNFQQSFLFYHHFEHIVGKYLVFINNDIVVTPNWLTNMITCAQSDISIGLVNAVTSNISNLQQVSLSFNNYTEMVEQSSKYNVSNPILWHERLRIITNGTLIKTDCLMAIGWPLFDPGFHHDFADDDIAFRVRRAGYKVILAKDTWIHHDHVRIYNKQEDLNNYQKSLDIGKENFKQKYFGIDAWDDVNNFEPQMISMIEKPINTSPLNILGIDCLAGTPILEVKNKLREFQIFDTISHSFTQDAKYYIDLKTICNGYTECDRVEYISEYFPDNSFDYIILGTVINSYRDSFKLLNDIYKLLNKNGVALIKLKNTNDVISFLQIAGYTVNNTSNTYPTNIELKEFLSICTNLGFKTEKIIGEPHNLDNTNTTIIDNLSKNIMNEQSKKAIYVNNYIIKLKKG